jgi:hypothetical protein
MTRSLALSLALILTLILTLILINNYSFSTPSFNKTVIALLYHRQISKPVKAAIAIEIHVSNNLEYDSFLI